MDFLWKSTTILLFTVALKMIFGTVQGIKESNRSKTNVLRDDLRHFDTIRHHVKYPAVKEQIRKFIQKRFLSFGLHTWTETFSPDGVTKGVNVVAMLPGKLARTRQDRIILIGAHYDTTRTSYGADDNGSGVVALLHVAKLLAETQLDNPEALFIKAAAQGRWERHYSVMFVAFDFEESETGTAVNPACSKLGCGSRAFVANFSKYYQTSFKFSLYGFGQLQGAIIMDTMMNYNSTPYSQKVPPTMKTCFRDLYDAIRANKFRGDFLLAVGRRRNIDSMLLNTFASSYNKVGTRRSSKYKIQVFQIPFDEASDSLNDTCKKAMSPFLRSDHVSFWNKILFREAILLSDTADLRSYMKDCYHKNCDNLNHVTEDFLGFLSKSCDAIVMTTNRLIEGKCRPSSGLTTVKKVGIGIGSVAAAVANAVMAYVCKRCRNKKDGDEEDLMGSSEMEIRDEAHSC